MGQGIDTEASVAALTFPFKYRPQSGKFEPTFGIGVSGGVTINPWRFNEHTFSMLAALQLHRLRWISLAQTLLPISLIRQKGHR